MALITSSLPDLVLLDLGLPDMDGVEIIKKTRKWSSMPIIVISARTQEKEKVIALDAGADDYITKPFGTNELLARIRTAIAFACLRWPVSVGAPIWITKSWPYFSSKSKRIYAR